MLKSIRFILLFLSVLPAAAHATLFSTAGVVDGSSSFSTTTDGITMTIDNPSPNGLANFPDGFDALDVGDATSFGGRNLASFDVSFNTDVLVSGFYVPVNPFGGQFSVDGPTMYPLSVNINYQSGYISFANGPLKFYADDKYTFTSTSGLFPLGGLEATAVPLPSAAWLFSSGILAMSGVLRRRR